jgi:hypothetical protein
LKLGVGGARREEGGELGWLMFRKVDFLVDLSIEVELPKFNFVFFRSFFFSTEQERKLSLSLTFKVSFFQDWFDIYYGT